MSIGGNGDDDIEDELRRLTDEISELTRLLEFALVQGEEPGDEDGGEGIDRGDLWNIGTTALQVDSIEQYEELRAVAASDEETTAPMFGPNAFDSRAAQVEARYELFSRGFDSLQSAEARMSKTDFKEFVQLFVKRLVGNKATADLIKVVDPSPGFFGIRKVNNELSITRANSPLSLQVVWGEFYHPASAPWVALGKRNPPEEELDRIEPRLITADLNRNLAEAAFDIGKLPDEYAGLLPEDKFDEWQEKNR